MRDRTKEIGVRKSIGARSRDILRQFLIDAAFISEAGAVLGIIFGIIVGDLVAAWLKVDLIFPYGWALAGLPTTATKPSCNRHAPIACCYILLRKRS